MPPRARAALPLLLLSRALSARGAGAGVAPARGVDAALDCGVRSLARDFAAFLFPADPAAVALVFDALRLGAECGEAPPPARAAPRRAPPPPPPARGAAAALVYVSPLGSDASGDGSAGAPFATLARALRASRGGAAPAQIVMRGGTYALDAPVVLTAADSGLSIAAAAGEAPLLSGGAPLAGLAWARVRPGPPAGMSGPLPGVSVVSSDPGLVPGGNVSGAITFLGAFDAAAACAAAALALPAATAYTWHDATVADGWARQCYARVDGQWAPQGGFPGHFSGQRTAGVNASVWRAALPAGTVPFLNLYDAATGRRLVRAKAPNGNPETTIDGFAAGATAWGAPRAFPPPQDVVVQSPARADDPFFPTYQLGVGGTCAQFEPAEGFWCSTNPPAGAQYNVPSNVTLPPGLFPGAWDNAVEDGALFHAFHGERWGNWAFQVAAADAAAGTLAWQYGGFQEARGARNGDTFMMEGVLDFLDDYAEWHLSVAENALYVMFNASSPPSPATTLIATRLDSLVRLEGSADAPVANVTLSGLAFAHTAPTYMKPSAMASGGDWSVRRDAALWLEGTAGATVSACDFVGLGGNAVFLNAWNRDATIADSRFRFLGDSAVVSLGAVAGIDGTAQNVPARTRVLRNVMSELGLYTKQSGAYYHALSMNATVVGNAMFNIPRAGININDGYGGGNVVANNLCFNAVRETSDHGVSRRAAAPRPSAPWRRPTAPRPSAPPLNSFPFP